jgi:hypothetical protein
MVPFIPGLRKPRVFLARGFLVYKNQRQQRYGADFFLSKETKLLAGIALR